MNLHHYKPLFAPASLFTVSFLFFGLFVLLLVVGVVTTGTLPPLSLVLLGVVVLNVLIWLVGPKLNELFMRFVYAIEWMDFQDFEQLYPERAGQMEAICDEHELDTPKMGIIDDATPMAMTFGSDHWNSRVVFSRGLDELLEPEEFDSVLAHELGHIRHRDFILMTVLNTLLQAIFIVYLYCRVLTRRADDRARALFAATAVVTYVFFVLSKYLQLYVSRTREYKADSFAADYMGPQTLSSALVKISYGLARESRKEDRQLDEHDGEDGAALESTEKKKRYKDNIVGPMNIMEIDSNEDKNVGELMEAGQRDHARYAMLYDAHSPWAKISEIHSTHPLTGNRIKALEDTHGETIFKLDHFREMNRDGIRTMRKTFWDDLKVLSAKYVGALVGLVAAIWMVVQSNGDLNAVLLGAGLTVLLYAVGAFAEYRRRFPADEPEDKQVGELYTYFDASPVHGIKVSVDGHFLGRHPAGHQFSPHTTVQDATGFVPTLFSSRLGWIGRIWKGWKHTAEYIGTDATVTGWYYRKGSNNLISQDEVNTTNGSWTSYPRFWFVVKLGILALVAAFLIAVGVVL